jgi:hypothetical protein
MHVIKAASLLLELTREIAVDLHDVEASHAFGERPRQCAMAAADFHEVLVAAGPDGCHDPLDDPRIVQKVLAESLAHGRRH